MDIDIDTKLPDRYEDEEFNRRLRAKRRYILCICLTVRYSATATASS